MNVRATAGGPAPTRSVRATVAVAAVTAVNRLSRVLGRGSGTVAGGRTGLVVDPGLLATLATGRRVALVTGTNGKTTTTRLLSAALAEPDGSSVPVSNDTGANMPAGHVAALAASPDAGVAVLEVDEGYLGRLITEVAPEVVVLLNLSRDQLDRIAEVRMVVDRWRTSLAALSRPGPGRPGHHRGGQRRRPDDRLRGGHRPRGPLGGGGPGVARRCGGLPGLRRQDRVRRRRPVGVRPV